MTAISPLQSIHKKGHFGDHHKIDEADLLNILEVKDLMIVQINQFKKSKIHLKSISVDGLELSLQNSKVLFNKDTRIIWSGPKTWLVVSNKENIIEIIKKDCDSENFAITDISHSRAIVQIKGRKAIEVLKKGCPINFNNFIKNSCAGSVFNGITIVIDFIDNDPFAFNIFTLRSFGESLYYHITDAALEFGYSGK